MRIAINGFGRIGRLVYRLLSQDSNFEIVAINDLASATDLAYLLKYDSNHGRFHEDSIEVVDNKIIDQGHEVLVYAYTDPETLPWRELNIDLVVESTGKFVSYDGAYKHILAGAKQVLISAPGKGDMKTVVYGVNHGILDGNEKIISCASCTTNCLAPILDVIDKNFGIVSGYMTTIHAYTNDQVILDVAHKKGIKSRRGRSAASNIVPTSTGACSAIGKVLPNLDGKLDGVAMRVPVTTGSCVDLCLTLNTLVDEEKINNAFKEKNGNVLKITFDPIVSSDVVGDLHGSLVDGLLTNVLDTDGKQLVKIVGWYDNEMGYSAQMCRVINYLNKIKK